MSKEEKYKLAVELYKKLGVECEKLSISRIEEINADFFMPGGDESYRGGSLLIGDDGTYFVCGTFYPLDYYVDEFKSGKRHQLN